MREPVKKALFIGMASDKQNFFEKAQQKGFIEFIPKSDLKKRKLPKPIEAHIQALKYLRSEEVSENPVTSGDALWASERVIELKHLIASRSEERRALNSEITRVRIFGDFSWDTINDIEQASQRHIQFFAVKHKNHLDGIDNGLIYIGTDFDMDYFVSIAREKQTYPGMIEMHIERPLGQLEKDLKRVQSDIKNFEQELRNFATWKEHIHNALIDNLNTYNLEFANCETDAELDGALFSVEAWIPTRKLAQVRALCQNFSIHCEPIAVEKTDHVPTYLRNKGFSHVGEDLVNIYDVPAASDNDPSPWVFWSFILFFAIIVADGGYGLIYLLLALVLRFKFKAIKGAGKRGIALLTALGISCVAWGVLTSSYFGLNLNPDGPLTKYSLIGALAKQKASYHLQQQDDVYQFWLEKDPDIAGGTAVSFLTQQKIVDDGMTYPVYEEFSDNVLMEIAILVGLIHLCLSLARYSLRSWSNFGWICFMIGGFLYFPTQLDATSMVNYLGIFSKTFVATFGLQLVIVGLVAATILAIIQFRLGGLGEITKMIQVFADTLSYLRLYALGLAGMMMAATFNDLARDAGYVLGFFILILGHALNFTMGAVGGIIHGLRLNFLEWYHYSFEGGGRNFNPLRIIKNRR